MVNHLAAKVTCKLMPLFNIRDVTHGVQQAQVCWAVHQRTTFIVLQNSSFCDTRQE